MNLTTLKTSRLVLSQFTMCDAERVALLAGDARVSEMTTHVPHPYPIELAKKWIRTHHQQSKNNNFIFAIRQKETSLLIGCINLDVNNSHNKAAVGYWIGVDYWGQGICSEALHKIIDFGFKVKKLNRIWAQHKSQNIASAKVMLKVGMQAEGVLRQDFKSSQNEYSDICVKSILRSDFIDKAKQLPADAPS